MDEVENNGEEYEESENRDDGNEEAEGEGEDGDEEAEREGVLSSSIGCAVTPFILWNGIFAFIHIVTTIMVNVWIGKNCGFFHQVVMVNLWFDLN